MDASADSRKVVVLSLTLLAAAAAWPGRAMAADLYTPPFYSGGVNTQAACKIVNVSQKEQTVRYQLLAADGSVLFDTFDFVLAAGHVSAQATSGYLGQVYCHFVGPRRAIRASGSASSNDPPWNSKDTIALPAD